MLNPHINLTGQTAVVTGASRGIGAAAAKRFAAAGANVALLARSADATTALAEEIGANALAVSCDVADPVSVQNAFARITDRFGSADILVNNAGAIDPIARIEDADPDAWGKVVDINLKGPLYCIRAALPMMKAKGQGTIINISSGAATNALEGWSQYCTSKAALLMLTRCVHKEEAVNRIHCVGFSPGTVATEMQKSIKTSGVNPVAALDWSVHITPETAAEAIVWLTTDAARSYDGGDFSIKTEEGRKAVGLPV